jgi:hypothetical protein
LLSPGEGLPVAWRRGLQRVGDRLTDRGAASNSTKATGLNANKNQTDLIKLSKLQTMKNRPHPHIRHSLFSPSSMYFYNLSAGAAVFSRRLMPPLHDTFSPTRNTLASHIPFYKLFQILVLKLCLNCQKDDFSHIQSAFEPFGKFDQSRGHLTETA